MGTEALSNHRTPSHRVFYSIPENINESTLSVISTPWSLDCLWLTNLVIILLQYCKDEARIYYEFKEDALFSLMF